MLKISRIQSCFLISKCSAGALDDFEKLPSSCKGPEKESEPSTAKDLEPGPKDSNDPSLDKWGLSEGDIEAAAAEFEKSMKTMLGQDEELLRQWNEFAEQAASSNPGTVDIILAHSNQLIGIAVTLYPCNVVL